MKQMATLRVTVWLRCLQNYMTVQTLETLLYFTNCIFKLKVLRHWMEKNTQHYSRDIGISSTEKEKENREFQKEATVQAEKKLHGVPFKWGSLKNEETGMRRQHFSPRQWLLCKWLYAVTWHQSSVCYHHCQMLNSKSTRCVNGAPSAHIVFTRRCKSHETRDMGLTLVLVLIPITHIIPSCSALGLSKQGVLIIYL